MVNFFLEKVNFQELQIIFKRNLDRSVFIADSLDINEEKYRGFYIDFIDNNIDSPKYNFQEDALELSMQINCFKMRYLEAIEHIIYSRRGFWIKMLCLDWLHFFFNDIPLDKYLELNRRLTKSSNVALRMQSLLNIALTGKHNIEVKKLLRLLGETEDFITISRFMNNEEINSFLKKDDVEYLIKVINEKEVLTPDEKSNFINILTAYII